MKIPSPQELGLPEKFDSWRLNQEEAISVMVTDTKRATEICAPTGFGKTAAYVAAAILSNKPTCIVTANRGLQDQLMTDFASIGMVDIRGRRNYSCEMREDYTCEDGYASRCPYKGTTGCPSTNAEIRASISPLVVTNYDKWISARKYGQGMSHFTQVIFDEGHHAPDALAKAMQVVLHHREIEQDLGMNFLSPPESEDFRNWKSWAAEAKARAEEEMKAASHQIEMTPEPKSSWVKHFNHMKALARRLATICTAKATDWIVEEIKEGFQFDPIRPARYAESALLLHVPRIIVISATIRPKTMYMINLGKDSFTFKEFESGFDPARCPIYYIPTMRVDNKAGDLSMLWARHDQIAARRQDRKGTVHTISFARRDEIMGRSKFAKNMIFNERGEPSVYTVDEFRRSGPSIELVSPSFGTGYDFPGKDCEWQFICKVPFLDGRSKIIKARQEDDPEYGGYHAMQTLVQNFGRGMRSKDDRCENFICDDHFGKWFYRRFAHLAPKSFHAFYKEVEYIPQPPPAL